MIKIRCLCVGKDTIVEKRIYFLGILIYKYYIVPIHSREGIPLVKMSLQGYVESKSDPT